MNKSMADKSVLVKVISILFIVISVFTEKVNSQSDAECQSESSSSCNNKSAALPLKLIAIASILITSMIGVCLPLFSRAIPALSPDRNLFVIVKAFASGIILATGFMHVLPDSFDMLWSPCLTQNPWHKFPFTGFIAMLSAILTLMVDSIATSLYTKKNSAGIIPEDRYVNAQEPHFHGHHHGPKTGNEGTQLLRYRVVAMVRN